MATNQEWDKIGAYLVDAEKKMVVQNSLNS